MSQHTAADVCSNLQSDRRIDLLLLWDSMFRGARTYVEDNEFVGVHNMPEIVGVTGACENVDTLFKVDFFGKQAYLAQSDQLYLELLTPKLGRVYSEIQSFRMEPEADDRHLCQFSLFEIEHLGGLDLLMGHIRGVVYTAVESVLFDVQKFKIHNLLSDDRVEYLKNFTIDEITYSNAITYLQQEGFSGLQWGDDLKAEHEAKIVAKFGPVFVTHYPLPIKFFNMKQNDIDERVVNSCDLLLPFAGESAGAAERETEYDALVSRLKSSDMYKRLIALGGTDADFEWYLSAHRNNDVPLHSGAGIGMARLAQFILGVDDIRDSVPFLINSENLL